jgi:hypothetical protein
VLLLPGPRTNSWKPIEYSRSRGCKTPVPRTPIVDYIEVAHYGHDHVSGPTGLLPTEATTTTPIGTFREALPPLALHMCKLELEDNWLAVLLG